MKFIAIAMAALATTSNAVRLEEQAEVKELIQTLERVNSRVEQRQRSSNQMQGSTVEALEQRVKQLE